jgi:hypothetical protein
MKRWCNAVDVTYLSRDSKEKLDITVPVSFLAAAIRYLRIVCEECDRLKNEAHDRNIGG